MPCLEDRGIPLPRSHQEWCCHHQEHIRAANSRPQGCIRREGASEAAPRLEEFAEAVGGSYCRLRMPWRLRLAVRGTVAIIWSILIPRPLSNPPPRRGGGPSLGP